MYAKEYIELTQEIERLEKKREEVKIKAMQEVEENGEPIKHDGFVVSLFTAGTRLDYSANEAWLKGQKDIDKIKRDVQKPIEKKMSLAYKNGVTLFDDETGEVFAPAKYKSGGKETIRITKDK